MAREAGSAAGSWHRPGAQYTPPWQLPHLNSLNERGPVASVQGLARSLHPPHSQSMGTLRGGSILLLPGPRAVDRVASALRSPEGPDAVHLGTGSLPWDRADEVCTIIIFAHSPPTWNTTPALLGFALSCLHPNPSTTGEFCKKPKPARNSSERKLRGETTSLTSPGRPEQKREGLCP